MAFSTGARNTAQLAFGWLVAAAVATGVVTHFDEVRTTLGMKIDPETFEGLRGAPSNRETMAAVPRSSDRTVQLRASSNGHFETRAHINGRPVDVMVDTGATVVALSWEDARAAGIPVVVTEVRLRADEAKGWPDVTKFEDFRDRYCKWRPKKPVPPVRNTRWPSRAAKGAHTVLGSRSKSSRRKSIRWGRDTSGPLGKEVGGRVVTQA